MSTNIRLKRSSVKGKSPTTSNLDLGEIAINTNDGRLFFKTTDSASTSAIQTLREITAGTGVTVSQGEVSITNSGVTADTYGSSTQIPIFSVNAQGQIDSASTVQVAGVSGFAYDSGTNLLTLSTADGGSYSVKIDLETFSDEDTTDDLNEGSTNLYYTDARVQTYLGAVTGDILPATDSAIDLGSPTKKFRDLYLSNNTIYLGNARLSFDSDNNQIVVNNNLDSTVALNYDLSNNTTDDLPVGSTNLYYDSDRTQQNARDAISVSGDALSYDASSGLITFSEVAYQGFDSDFNAKSTDDLSEGTNLYFTTQRVRDSLSVSTDAGDGSLAYDSATGRISYTGVTASETRSHFSVAGDLSYDSALGRFSYVGRTDLQVRGLISVNDVSGDGSLQYNSTSGEITYVGPSASEVRAHFSAGTGVTITNGEVAIAQPVGTADDVQFGKVTVDSAQVDCLHLTKLPEAPNSLRGLLYYDSDPQKGLSFVPTTNELVEDVTINLGQEHLIYVHNLTGAQINNGDAVYVSGTAHGIHPQVTLAKADASSTSQVTGIATMDIPNGNHGYITQFGLVNGLNTAGMTEGSFAYLSADSAGKWSTTEVSIDQGYPTHVGRVISVDSVSGSLLVNVEKEHAEYLRVEDRIIVDGSATMDSAVATNLSTNYVDFTPQDTPQNPTPSQVEGRVFYHDEYKALTVYNDITGSSLQLGHEEWVRVYNNSGSTISNGTPCRPTGAFGESQTVAPADATSASGARVLGLATHDIPNNSYGVLTVRGLASGFDTSGLNAGGPVWLAADGSLTTTAPTFPYFPTQVGGCIVVDSAAGYVYVSPTYLTQPQSRTTGNAHIDGNLTVDGDLTVTGSQSTISQSNLSVDNSFIYLNSGNTIGDANTTFSGTGLDDGFFTGHYEGTTTKTYYARIDGVLTGAGGVDTFEWSFDSDFATTEGIKIPITGADQSLVDNVNMFFNATTGHDSGDVWYGTAAPTNVDTGWFTNRNTGATGVGYTHLGIYFDVSDGKFKAIDEYAPEPSGSIDNGDSSYNLATFVASQFEGNLTGDVTGDLTGLASSATLLDSASLISLTGDISGGVTFDGSQNVSITTSIVSNSIVNADINSSAAIADTKLDTISTAGKVQNSATTATSTNTASTIVERDGSGNFSAGTMTGTATNANQLNSQDPSYYLDYDNFTNAPNIFKNINIEGLDTFQPDSANDTFNIRAGSGISLSVDSANDAVIIDTKATTPLVTDLFTATQGQSAFSLTSTPIAEQDLIVFVEGVYQNYESYVLSGTTMTFDETLDSGMEVVVHAVGSNLVSGDVQFGQAVSGTRVGYTTNTSETTIATFDKTKYRTMKLQVQITDTVANEYEMSEMNLVHDNTTATTTEFGIVYTGDSDLGDMDANISGNNLNVTFTSANSNNKTIKLHFNAIKV